MKVHLISFLIVVGSLVSALTTNGQPAEIEKSFDQRRASYKVVQHHEVDTSSPSASRFEYLYYRDGEQLIKIRMIEVESPQNKPSVKVDDYFFVNGDLRLVRLYFFIADDRLQAIRKGSVVPLLTGEHIELEDGSLTRWIALGKEIPRTDRRWADKQTSVLLSARVERLKYESIRKSQ